MKLTLCFVCGRLLNAQGKVLAIRSLGLYGGRLETLGTLHVGKSGTAAQFAVCLGRETVAPRLVLLIEVLDLRLLGSCFGVNCCLAHYQPFNQMGTFLEVLLVRLLGHQVVRLELGVLEDERGGVRKIKRLNLILPVVKLFHNHLIFKY